VTFGLFTGFPFEVVEQLSKTGDVIFGEFLTADERVDERRRRPLTDFVDQPREPLR
jgi:hypothetical protein